MAVASPRPTAASWLALVVVLAACTGGPTTAPSSGPSAAPGACGAAPPVAASDVQAWIAEVGRPPIVPVIASSQQACGGNRILIGLLDDQNRPIGSPDYVVRASFFDLGRDATTHVAAVDTEFVWAIEGERGLYVANVELGESGTWGAELLVSLSGVQHRLRIAFDVQPTGVTKRVGERAPASQTPTAADVGGDLAKLSTDDQPDARFYEMSVDDALAAKEPFVLVFATPKFCTSAVCGPTLDRVKPFLDAYPTVTFINVEPYQLEYRDGGLHSVTEDRLTPVAATEEWALVTEPWVFVVDREGVIRGSFEGVVGDEELRRAIASIS